MMNLIFLLIIFIASYALTGLVRNYSLRKAILDIPNERSSHTVPTPRGGGIAIALSFFAGVSWLAWQDMISLSLAKALLGGGFLVAATGYWDDLRSLSAKVRSVLHLLAAIWVLYCLDGFPILSIGTAQLHLGWFGGVLAVVGIVWMINLYNFMDGIDGIAGSEAVFVSAVAGVTFYLLGVHGAALLCFVLLAATAGFLIWNWPPAKIFLGDIGSGLLGFIFAVIALASAKQHSILLVPWLILLAFFILDTMFTLVHRMLRGERWYTAHREHIYQRLTLKGLSHKKVVLIMLAINLFILLPVFYFAVTQPNLAVWLLLFCIILFARVWRRIVILAPRLNDLKTALQPDVK